MYGGVDPEELKKFVCDVEELPVEVFRHMEVLNGMKEGTAMITRSDVGEEGGGAFPVFWIRSGRSAGGRGFPFN